MKLDICLIQTILFADNTVAIARPKEDLIQNVGKCHQIVNRHGLAINWGKMSSMLFSREPTSNVCQPLPSALLLLHNSRKFVGCSLSKQGRPTVGVRLSVNGGMESD